MASDRGGPQLAGRWPRRIAMHGALRMPLFAAALGLGACAYPYFANHYIGHPDRQPPDVVTWQEDVVTDHLLIHVIGARPSGEGPFPAVIVLPEGGGTAPQMQGIVWNLAAHGYVAIAADYERLIDGAYERNMFAWRAPGDVTAIVDVANGYPAVDRERIGLLGFSQGGVLSLLIAAYAPDRVKAVVSYYPVTDFVAWLNAPYSGGKGVAFSIIRWYFRSQSGAANDAEFDFMLRGASAYYVAEQIEAPVLLVHGDRDTTAPVAESQRMAERLTALGKPVRLLVVQGGVHIFNFRQPPQTALAWEATMQFLDENLGAEAASR